MPWARLAIVENRLGTKLSMKKPKLSQTTLPHIPGELELSVMTTLWRNPNIGAKQILEHIAKHHSCNLSTIQSTLERLMRKGMLTRHKQGHAFLYTTLVSRGELLGGLLKDVINLLHDGSPRTILSSFVTAASKIDDSALEELDQLIRHKRAQQEASDD